MSSAMTSGSPAKSPSSASLATAEGSVFWSAGTKSAMSVSMKPTCKEATWIPCGASSCRMASVIAHAAAVGFDDRSERAGNGQRAEVVRLHLQSHIIHRAREQGRAGRHACVVDQDVDVAGRTGGAGDGLRIRDVELSGYNAGHGDRLGAPRSGVYLCTALDELAGEPLTQS